MKSSIITSKIWQQITEAAKLEKKKSLVAVAYFGKDGSTMLPLKGGSSLVVDASEFAVKTGQTCPAELLKLYKKGVKIYSYRSLHAKVFVLNSALFIGSTNVSGRSSNLLQEAVFKTNDKQLVLEAKKFIESLSVAELGPEKIKHLDKIYRPPIVPGGSMLKSSVKKSVTGLPDFYICRVKETEEYSKGYEQHLEMGKNEARMKRIWKARHFIEEFQWSGNTLIKEGDMVIEVYDSGKSKTVWPPSMVINIKRWNNNTRSFIFLEMPNKKEKRLDVVTKRIDQRIFKRSGKINSESAASIAALWK